MKWGWHWGLCACLALHSGWLLALPDLERGLQALSRGDAVQAKADLLPLAELGYTEAQIALARLYATDTSQTAQRQAEHWLREAQSQDPSARPRLIRLLLAEAPDSDPMEIDRLLTASDAAGEDDVLRLRVRLYRYYPDRFVTREAAAFAAQAAASHDPDIRSEALAWYRVHASSPEYADAMQQLCLRDLAMEPDCHADLVRAARLSGNTDRYQAWVTRSLAKADAGQLPDQTLERVARTLAAEDLPGSPQTKAAYTLFRQIEPRSAETRVRIAKLLLTDPSLDEQANAHDLLVDALQAGSNEAALVLGREYLRAGKPQADPVRARNLLQRAAQTDQRANYHLGRLFERGYLGRVEPERALQHYLRAARHRHPRADLALSRMFWNDRGIRVDPINAYAFALLASHHGLADASTQLEEIGRTLNTGQREQATQLAQQEFRARRAKSTSQRLARTVP